MNWETITYSRHAIQRMFERGLSPEEVREAVCGGEMIGSYPDDEPLPSMLILAFPRGRPVHVVIARDDERRQGHVITAYVPDQTAWDEGFRERKAP